MSTVYHLLAAILFFMSTLCSATFSPFSPSKPINISGLVIDLTLLNNASSYLLNKTEEDNLLNGVVQSNNQINPSVSPEDSVIRLSTEAVTSLEISTFDGEQNTVKRTHVVNSDLGYIKPNITSLGRSNISESDEDSHSSNHTFSAIHDNINSSELPKANLSLAMVKPQGMETTVPLPTIQTSVSKILNAITQQINTITKENSGNEHVKITEARSITRDTSTLPKNEIGVKVPKGETVKYVSGLTKRTESPTTLQGSVASRAMAVFLAIAIALVAFLALIYFIYARSQRKDLFSHHRLYDNGYDEPVHYLDGPMDFYDGTPMDGAYGSIVSDRPASLQLPAQACDQGPPLGISSMEHLRDIIQLDAIPPPKISKTAV
ncbi:uncharacterized protein LOC122791794 [Protopterus annectens]|uniref:uncharacterized protein LOC122791794 n=1 Tax=Protopterus annectens TaxID=7888 RepID=UPI001CFA8F54|nr:uncharacterized protein LOC122791794 [Protopterus annectens]